MSWCAGTSRWPANFRPLRAYAGALRRPVSGRMSCVGQGRRPLRSRSWDCFFVVCRADHPRRAQAPLPRQGIVDPPAPRSAGASAEVQTAEAELSDQTHRSPTVVEIAEHLSVDVEQVLEALDAIAARRADSLDAPLAGADTDEPATIHDKVGADDDRYALIDTSASLAAGIKRLRAADRRVLELRVATSSSKARSPNASESHKCRCRGYCGVSPTSYAAK